MKKVTILSAVRKDFINVLIRDLLTIMDYVRDRYCTAIAKEHGYATVRGILFAHPPTTLKSRVSAAVLGTVNKDGVYEIDYLVNKQGRLSLTVDGQVPDEMNEHFHLYSLTELQSTKTLLKFEFDLDDPHATFFNTLVLSLCDYYSQGATTRYCAEDPKNNGVYLLDFDIVTTFQDTVTIAIGPNEVHATRVKIPSFNVITLADISGFIGQYSIDDHEIIKDVETRTTVSTELEGSNYHVQPI